MFLSDSLVKHYEKLGLGGSYTFSTLSVLELSQAVIKLKSRYLNHLRINMGHRAEELSQINFSTSSSS